MHEIFRNVGVSITVGWFFFLYLFIVIGGIIWACVLASKIEVKEKRERIVQYCLALLFGPFYVLFYYVS